MIPNLDPEEWEWVGLGLVTVMFLSVAAYWAVLEWLEIRAARRPARPAPRHRNTTGLRTRRIAANRYRRPSTAADLDD